MNIKEIIGYKLKDEKFREAAERISVAGLIDLDKGGYHVRAKTAIEDLFRYLEILDEWFEPVFKEDFELGLYQWYIAKYADQLIYRTGNAENVGFIGGEWSELLVCSSPNEFRLATQEELIKAFVKESEKRGYKVGVRTQYGVIDNDNDGKVWEHEFDLDENCFYYHNICVYDDGKWAEIKPEREVVGFIVKHKKFVKPAKSLINDPNFRENYFESNVKEYGFNFTANNGKSGYDKMFRDLGILDKWFKPVYAPKTEIPISLQKAIDELGEEKILKILK